MADGKAAVKRVGLPAAAPPRPSQGPSGSPSRQPSRKAQQMPPAPLRKSHSVMAIIEQQDKNAEYKAPASGGFESLNYDEAENLTIRARYQMGTTERVAMQRRESAVQWFLVSIIGILVGSFAYFTTFGITTLSRWKFDAVYNALEKRAFYEGYAVLSAFVVGLALTAAALTRWSPEAAGSGIPHVKAYLNGNRLDGALRPRTLVAKVLGIICCVSLGMPAGREGPMVHTGAIVANVVGTWLPKALGKWLRVDFHNDFVRRNFVSMGAAAGVAAAFHAPIGGILFSLEEVRVSSVPLTHAAVLSLSLSATHHSTSAMPRSDTPLLLLCSLSLSLSLSVHHAQVSSFWDPTLTLLTFFMVAFAALTVAFWTQQPTFGTFEDVGHVIFPASESRSPYDVWEVGLFVIMSAVLGLFGALFNELNKRLTIFRRKLQNKYARNILGGDRTMEWRGVEAILSIWLVLSLFYVVPFAFPCRETLDGHSFDGHYIGTHAGHSIFLVPYQCNSTTIDHTYRAVDNPHHRRLAAGAGVSSHPPSEFNEMATLLMQPQDGAILQLFSRGTAGFFLPSTCLLFFLLYFCSAVFVYGVAVPSGLFVPGMLIGGGFGRFIGELVHSAGGMGARADPGLYALVGAAGMLGGVTRMTMSLAVIILEVSNDTQLLIPIMLAIGISKQVGDAFNRSLYDIHIGLTGVPMIATEEVSPEAQNVLNAKSVMSLKVCCVNEAEYTGKLQHILKTTSHNGFPVTRTDPLRPDKLLFAGIISRVQIMSILQDHEAGKKRAVSSPSPSPTAAPGAAAPSGAPAAGWLYKRPAPSTAEAKAPVASAKASAPAEGESAGAGSSSNERQPYCGDADAVPGGAGNSCHGLQGAGAPRASERRRRGSWTPDDGEGLIDLRPHCDRSPYVVNELLPLRRVFRLFTTMGLRHLVVVDDHSLVVGMITRKDFLKIGDGKAAIQRQLSRRRQDTHRRYEIQASMQLSQYVQANTPDEPVAAPSPEDPKKKEFVLMRAASGALRRFSTGAIQSPTAIARRASTTISELDMSFGRRKSTATGTSPPSMRAKSAQSPTDPKAKLEEERWKSDSMRSDGFRSGPRPARGERELMARRSSAHLDPIGGQRSPSSLTPDQLRNESSDDTRTRWKSAPATTPDRLRAGEPSGSSPVMNPVLDAVGANGGEGGVIVTAPEARCAAHLAQVASETELRDERDIPEVQILVAEAPGATSPS